MDASGDDSHERTGSPAVYTIPPSCARPVDCEDPVLKSGHPLPNTALISSSHEKLYVLTPASLATSDVLPTVPTGPSSTTHTELEDQIAIDKWSRLQAKKRKRKEEKKAAAALTATLSSASKLRGSAVLNKPKLDKGDEASSNTKVCDAPPTSNIVSIASDHCVHSQIEEHEAGSDTTHGNRDAEGAIAGGFTSQVELASDISRLLSAPSKLTEGCGAQDTSARPDVDLVPTAQTKLMCETPPPAADPALEPIPALFTWEHFVSRRQKLLQEAITDSVRSGTFHNVKIYAYSKRQRILRSARSPAVVHARVSFLEASSPVLKKLLKDGRRQLSEIPSSKRDFEYLDDSDLEDEGFEDTSSLEDQKSDISDIASNVSSFDLMDNSPPLVHARGSSSYHSPSTDKTQEPSTTESDVIYVPFGAAKTWQSLIMYLYDGTITFTSLKTAPSQSMSDTSCSPKSMYRLALQLELTELAKICEAAIVNDLYSSNVVDELFNDFTWRYPEILSREVEVFGKHAIKPSTRADLKRAFGDMALGKLPRRDVVLSALFDNMLPPTDTFVR